MSYQLRYKIFQFFGVADKLNDPNKNAQNKGTQERTMETVAKFIDTDVTPLIDSLADNMLDPKLMLSQYINYAEYDKGVGLSFYNTDDWRRRVVRYIHRWYEIKGTKKCYNLMFAMLGISCVLTELFWVSGLDSPITFDDTDRVFDLKCATCSRYTLTLTGGASLTPALEAAINEVIKFNKPLGAVLVALRYNATNLTILPSYNDNFNDDI